MPFYKEPFSRVKGTLYFYIEWSSKNLQDTTYTYREDLKNKLVWYSNAPNLIDRCMVHNKLKDTTYSEDTEAR